MIHFTIDLHWASDLMWLMAVGVIACVWEFCDQMTSIRKSTTAATVKQDDPDPSDNPQAKELP